MLLRVQKAILRALYTRQGIEAVNRDLATRTTQVDQVLADYGATVAGPGVLHGPLFMHNADGSYENLYLGANVHIGRAVTLDLARPLRIGQDATVSMGCILLTHTDVGDRPLKDRVPANAEPLQISAGAYLGAGVIVLPGCHIGEEAIVGAGSVVTRPVPAGTKVAGSPARTLDRQIVSQ